jgi:hypothetical protein
MAMKNMRKNVATPTPTPTPTPTQILSIEPDKNYQRIHIHKG